MTCACGLRWDVNDPNPPTCRRTRHVSPVPNGRRELLIGARKEANETRRPRGYAALNAVIPVELAYDRAFEMAQAYAQNCHKGGVAGMRAAYRIFLDSLI